MDRDLQDEIRHITAQLVERYHAERIILFGSAARGKLAADSDVDFLIIKTDCPPIGRDRVRELHRLIDRNIPVDFLVYRPEEFDGRLAMGDPFLEAILRDGKALHG